MKRRFPACDRGECVGGRKFGRLWGNSRDRLRENGYQPLAVRRTGFISIPRTGCRNMKLPSWQQGVARPLPHSQTATRLLISWSRNGQKNINLRDSNHERAANGRTRIYPYIVFSRGAATVEKERQFVTCVNLQRVLLHTTKAGSFKFSPRRPLYITNRLSFVY